MRIAVFIDEKNVYRDARKAFFEKVSSTDTDLLPGIEALYELDRGLGIAPVEVSAWSSDRMHKRLRVRGHALWCHELAFKDYQKVADLTDYNIAP